MRARFIALCAVANLLHPPTVALAYDSIATRATGAPTLALGASSTPKADDVNTWAIFGFADGSDTGPRGDRTPFYESITRLSRQQGEFSAFQGYLGLAYAVTNSTTLWLSASAFNEHVGPLGLPAGSDPAGSAGFGASIGAKYQIVDRRSSIVGLAVQVEPFWQRVMTTSSGAGSRQVLGSQFRLILDAALVPGWMYGAVNLAYDLQSSWTGTSVEPHSRIETAAAAAARVIDNVFIGAELRHLSAYRSHLPTEHVGYAVFLGPTLSVNLGPNAYAGLAWSAQIVGRADQGPGRSLDLVNFERHQLRVKAGFTF